MTIEPFTALATRPQPPIDELALALAAEFGEVDDAAVLARLDELGEEVAAAFAAGSGPTAGIDALREVLGVRHGFCGERERYDDPRNSMLDVVLERRRGLPILLSVLYVATARRAGIALEGVGLPGHYVAGDFGTSPPLLLDPFDGGSPVQAAVARATCARGARTRRRCGCSTTSSTPTGGARTSCARSRRRSCGSRCRSTRRSRSSCTSSSAPCARA